MQRAISCVRALWRDESGSVLVYLTLAFTTLIGVCALGAEGAWYLYTHRIVQSAADSAAYSVAAAYAADSTSNLATQARAIAANDYGLINGQDGATVAVNRPPSGACYSGTSHYTSSNAIEVVVTQTRGPLFSRIWTSSNHSICGRAIALVPSAGDCLLALGTTGTVIGVASNNVQLNLTGCGLFSNSSDVNSILVNGNNDILNANAIGTVGGITLSGNQKTTVFNPAQGAPPVADPYFSSAASWPKSSSATTSCASCTTRTAPACSNGKGGTQVITLTANSTFTNLQNFNNCTTVNFPQGTYLFAQGVNTSATLSVAAGSTIIVSTGGFNTAAVTFTGSGNTSISIQGGGWTSSGNLSMAGSYAVSVTGDFSIGGTNSTLGAGIYYISGKLNITGTTTTANNATMVLTGVASIINYTANNATFTLTAPTASGWNQGIAVWEPNSTGINLIANGNSSVANISGVFYAPGATVNFAGNTGATPVCTQIVAKAMSFAGNSVNITGDCASVPGVKTFGEIPALVE